MRLVLTFIIILTSVSIYAQTEAGDTIKKSVDLDEIVVSANKTEEMKRNVASQISVITSKQIQFDNPQTSGDILANTGQIMVQKSQQGGGSPVIRGFEASRILLVVDGVRMNNLIYRGGHLQNIVTIDPSVLEKVEVFFGASSTIYGSDALGGTVHFITKKPILDANGKKPLTLKVMQRFSSANNGNSTNINFNFGFKKMASLTSISYNKFGDLKMGKNKNPFYDTLFGLRGMYAARISGKDSGVISENEYLQTTSGYSQMDLLQKVLFRQNNNVEHQLNIQYSNSSNIPRYDRLTEVSKGKPKYAEWYYGPQTRLLAGYDINIKNKLRLNNIHLGVNNQRIQESRISRNFDGNDLDTRVEDVGVIGYNLDFQKKLRRNNIRFGFDGQANKLKSTAHRANIITEEVTPLSTRYPDGKNTLNHNAIYFTHTLNYGSKLIFNDGFRVGMSALKSEVKDNTFFQLPVTSVKQTNLTRSAYLGVIYFPNKSLKLSYLASSGYRVPNIDDLSKVFETLSGNVIIPNPDLKPEQTITNEIGVSFKPTKKIRIETSVWHTLLSNAITIGGATLNGKDSIFYYNDSTKSKVFANQNSGKGVIYGYSISINADLTNHSQVYANLSYTKGTLTTAPVKLPLDHIAPITANLGYSHTIKKITGEGIIVFNGKKEIKEYSNSGEDNQQYAPKGGMPAWMILNFRASYHLPKNLVLQGGIENILDTNYRVFASGINGAGRNIYLAIRFTY
ncbi:MAG: TonB-dependent receptor plug domain-containing protein [Bacteroidia bacterium]